LSCASLQRSTAQPQAELQLLSSDFKQIRRYQVSETKHRGK